MSESKTSTFDELMARIGLLFLNWSLFENALKDRRVDLSAIQLPPDVEEARRIRNLIAHGILQASAYPEASPYLECKSKVDVVERITFEQLGAATSALERARFAVGAVP